MAACPLRQPSVETPGGCHTEAKARRRSAFVVLAHSALMPAAHLTCEVQGAAARPESVVLCTATRTRVEAGTEVTRLPTALPGAEGEDASQGTTGVVPAAELLLTTLGTAVSTNQEVPCSDTVCLVL